MNKSQLIDRLAGDAAITKAQATAALNSFMESVKDALKDGDKVTLVGFGTFSSNERAARIGRNPRTGAEINIAARKVVKFKAGKELDGSLNG